MDGGGGREKGLERGDINKEGRNGDIRDREADVRDGRCSEVEREGYIDIERVDGRYMQREGERGERGRKRREKERE